MVDEERMREQVEEMRANARIKAEVLNSSAEKTAKFRAAAEKDGAKFKFLVQAFSHSEKLLLQRRAELRDADSPENASMQVLEGLDLAIEEVRGLLRQSRDGSFQQAACEKTLSTLEESFRQDAIQATSRDRGLAVQGERAAKVAASRTGPEPQ